MPNNCGGRRISWQVVFAGSQGDMRGAGYAAMSLAIHTGAASMHSKIGAGVAKVWSHHAGSPTAAD